MTAPYYPFDRSTRISSVLTGNGSTKVFGPSNFKVFSADDVEVWRKLPGESVFSIYNGASIVLTGDAPATFHVIFPTAPVLNAKWFYKSRRLHERSTAIALANRLDLKALDAELTRLGTILQELYRDIGQAARSDPNLTAPTFVEAIAEGSLIVGGPSSSLKSGPSVSEIEGYRNAAQTAAALALQYANLALSYKNAMEQLAEAVLDAANLTESVLPTVFRFSGDGVETEFDLENDQIDIRATNVYIHGVYQQKDTYSIVAGVLTFESAPPAGVDNIEVSIQSSVSVSYEVAQLPEGLVGIEIMPSLPPIGNFEGRTVYLTTEDKLYVHTGSQWLPVIPASSGGGGELPDDAVFIELVAALPTTENFEGRTVYLGSDGRLYTFTAGQWKAVGGGGGGGGELPDGTVGIQIVNALPTDGNFEGRVVYLTSDGKLYTFTDGAWKSVNGIGGGSVPGLPDGVVGIEIVDVLPETDNFEGRIVYLETDGKLYTFTDGAWKTIVDITDVNFPDGFTGVQIVTELPTGDNFEGRIVYLETDGKLYRYHNDIWTPAVDAADIAGTITSTQIGTDAITTPKIAAGAITALKLGVGSVTADAILAGAINAAKIAAGAITTSHLGALAVTADKIAAGAITAAKMNVSNLAAVSATLGAVNISSAILGSLQVDTINLAGNAVTVQAGAETAGSVSIGGGGFSLIQSIGITWGAAASIWVFCQFRATTGDDLELDIRNNGVSVLSTPKSLRAPADAINFLAELFPAGGIPGTSGTIGFWLRRATSGTTTIKNRKIGVLAAKR